MSRKLVCERNESAASAHGHTDDCYAATSADSLVRCDVCGRERVVDFGTCLRSGWPKCDGYTMRLIHTAADIGRAVGQTFDEARAALTEVVR